VSSLARAAKILVFVAWSRAYPRRRHVRAVGVRAVAYVENLAASRRREHELPRSDVIVCGGGQHGDERPCDHGRAVEKPPSKRSGRERHVGGQQRKQQEKVVANESGSPDQESRSGEKDPGARCAGGRSFAALKTRVQAKQRPHGEQRREEFLHHLALVEEKRPVQRGSETGDEPGAAPENPLPQNARESGRQSAEAELHQPQEREIRSEGLEIDGEKVGIERALLEDVGAEPAPRHNRDGPFVVVERVEVEEVEVRRSTVLEKVCDAKAASDGRDDEGVAVHPTFALGF
jgi:hypothetical protein